MKNKAARFVSMMEPSELWTVWDNQSGAPAEFGPKVLIGLSKTEAQAACSIMNERYRNRMAANSEDAA